MADPKKQKQIVPINYEETFDPNSPYYIKPEERDSYGFYSTQGGNIQGVLPFSWDRVWAHPETGRLVSLNQAKGYWSPVIDPKTGEEGYEQLNPMLDEVVVPGWKEALKYVSVPIGNGRTRDFIERYKRKNNDRYSASPFDYNKNDDMGPIGPSAWEQAIEYSKQHPMTDPADNFLNNLLFDAITLGGTSAGRQFVGKGLGMLNNAGKTVVEGLGRATPSGLMEGISYYAPRAWAPTLRTIGKYGDATAASYFLGNAANNIGQGLYNRDTSQIAQGGLDAMYGLPMFESLRGTSSLMPTFNVALSPSSTSRFGNMVNNFISSPRTQAVAGGLGYGTLSAAASDKEDEEPNIFKKTWNWTKENPLDAAFTGYLTWKFGLKPVVNRYFRKPKKPTKFTYVNPDGTTVIKDVPQGTRVPAPEYQPVDELPVEAIPEGLVYPDYPNVPNIPTASEFGVIPEPTMIRPIGFNEKLIPHPGERPTTGKKLAKRQKQWDEKNRAYQEQQARLQEYNAQNAEAEEAWKAYDAPEQVDARNRFNQAQADYYAHKSEYDNQLAQYENATNQYQSDYNAALDKYNKEQKAAFPTSKVYEDWQKRDKLFTEYEAAKEYEKYNKALESWRKRKAIPKNIWEWIKQNPLGVTLGGWWLGDKIFGGDSKATTESTPTTNTTNTTKIDTLKILPGINIDSLSKAIEDSARNSLNRPNAGPPLADEAYDNEDDEGNN